jgi:hypothetical protein
MWSQRNISGISRKDCEAAEVVLVRTPETIGLKYLNAKFEPPKDWLQSGKKTFKSGYEMLKPGKDKLEFGQQILKHVLWELKSA